MTKEELIKQVYGKNYNACNPDKDGWSDEDERLGGFEFCDEKIDYLDFDMSNKWRPIELRGITNNNGWAKLTPEIPLPTQVGEYIVGQMNCGKFVEFKNKLPLHDLLYNIKHKTITHYKLYESLPPKF